MYPVLFRIGDFEVTSFGVMVAVAALVGLWLFRRRPRCPVHPTQLYEAIGLGLLGWVLIQWRRRGVSDATVLGRYLVIAGVLRFGSEFLRVNVRVAFGLSVAHLVSLAAIALGGLVLLIAYPTRRSVPSGSQLS